LLFAVFVLGLIPQPVRGTRRHQRRLRVSAVTVVLMFVAFYW